jgi:hypothetical protein
MTTYTEQTGNKTLTVSEFTNGYGENAFRARVSQQYNNGIEMITRPISSKDFNKLATAKKWLQKQL